MFDGGLLKTLFRQVSFPYTYASSRGHYDSLPELYGMAMMYPNALTSVLRIPQNLIVEMKPDWRTHSHELELSSNGMSNVCFILRFATPPLEFLRSFTSCDNYYYYF
jgi:hypothetical protein